MSRAVVTALQRCCIRSHAVQASQCIVATRLGRESLRRTYVSKSDHHAAKVTVDTVVQQEHKSFEQATGRTPSNVVIPGTTVNADAMMSPIAGEQ